MGCSVAQVCGARLTVRGVDGALVAYPALQLCSRRVVVAVVVGGCSGTRCDDALPLGCDVSAGLPSGVSGCVLELPFGFRRCFFLRSCVASFVQSCRTFRRSGL